MLRPAGGEKCGLVETAALVRCKRVNADTGTHYLADALLRFRSLRRLAERAIDQLDEAQWFIELAPGANSIAHLMKHLAGNMKSRWTKFLTSDGEKPDRNRDEEFEIGPADTADSLRRNWDEGWACQWSAIERLGAEDLDKTVLIRNEPQSVIEAINRHLGHCAMHVGQIVLIAKCLQGRDWRTLSIPRGGSDEFLQAMKQGKRTLGNKGMFDP